MVLREKPQWKIKGGGPYAIKSCCGDLWYVGVGSSLRLYTKDQKNPNLLPDDTTYKWYYGSDQNYAEIASGDVKIRGTL